MADPFAGLTFNNLQTINSGTSGATVDKRSMMMSAMQQPNPMLLPTMATTTTTTNSIQLTPTPPSSPMFRTITTTNAGQSTGSVSNDSDERQKFEKYRKFQLQQKRLQEMSFASTTLANTTTTSGNISGQHNHTSADQLMANIIQKVETEAKLDKRFYSGHKPLPSAVNAGNSMTIGGQVMTGTTNGQLSMISGANTMYGHQQHYHNQRSVMTNSGQIPTSASTINGYSVSQQQQQQPTSQSLSSSLYTQNKSLKTTPILHQLFSNNSCSADQQMKSSNNSINQNMTTTTIDTNQSTSASTNQTSLLPAAAVVVLSADSSTTSQFRQQQQQQPTVTSRQLPLCFNDHSRLPAVYQRVWQYVKVADATTTTTTTTDLCDTNKLYPVLLSVGLAQPVLAQLWSLVNQTVPGQLTQRELLMTLAMIALIQRNSLNPLEDMYRLDTLPVPIIQFFGDSSDSNHNNTNNSNQQLTIQSLNPNSAVISTEQQIVTNQAIGSDITKGGTPNNNNNNKLSNLGPNYAHINTTDDGDEDFDDFKSADFSTVIALQESAPMPTGSTLDQLMATTTTTTDWKPNFESSLPPSAMMMTTTTTSNTENDDDFADFKSATAISRPTKELLNTFVSPKHEMSPANNLSSALELNLKAMSSTTAATTTTTAVTGLQRSLTPNPTPVLTLSSVSSAVNSGQNTLDSSPADSFNDTMMSTNTNQSAVDRYSVFRELTSDSRTTTTGNGDDFGNFLSHETNFDAQSVDSLQFSANQDTNSASSDVDTVESVSQLILQTARQMIHKSFNVLVVSHGADSVLEAMRSSDGNRFAYDLLEVYSIVKRLATSLKSTDKLTDSLAKIIDDIDKTWLTINGVFGKADINLEKVCDIQLNQQNQSSGTSISKQCAICCCKATGDRPIITFAGHEYHTSCANLWLNCINPTLPQPIANCR
ncbi:synergin gamma-like [Oppia nitens]|uniref:synergin gamma-like n=1 Tax=Oppia nitens TaxID=1686743 RepID=UPI0023D9F980|nr:synergin gamma-like [Oppia nitens]